MQNSKFISISFSIISSILMTSFFSLSLHRQLFSHKQFYSIKHAIQSPPFFAKSPRTNFFFESLPTNTHTIHLTDDWRHLIWSEAIYYIFMFHVFWFCFFFSTFYWISFFLNYSSNKNNQQQQPQYDDVALAATANL